MRSKKAIALLLGVFALGSSIAAQDPNRPAPPPRIPLKVDVVLSRYEGDKKISSLPFTLWVNANDPQGQTSLRMGMDVAVPQTSDGKQTVSYRNVGTSIDCRAEVPDTGRIQLNLTIQDSSIYSPESTNRPAGSLSGYPAFRSFSSNTRVILREGQTVQFIAATDKISGEVTKVDVTVTTVK
jgi:hypothetical protein